MFSGSATVDYERVSHWNFKKRLISFIYNVPENNGGPSARHLFSTSVTVLAVHVRKMNFTNVSISAITIHIRSMWELREFSILCSDKLAEWSESELVSLLVSVRVCSRLLKTDMELEVLRYTNRISSEAHKMVRSFSAGRSICKAAQIGIFQVISKQKKKGIERKVQSPKLNTQRIWVSSSLIRIQDVRIL